jgi:hypothetical protein
VHYSPVSGADHYAIIRKLVDSIFTIHMLEGNSDIRMTFFHDVAYRSNNKVHEIATMCLPWQQWPETSVWFDDVGISAFHSCVVVDL